MEENLNPISENPELPRDMKLDYTARGREFIFGGVILLLSVLLCNFVFYGGFHLGFALAAMAAIGCSWLYLCRSGRKFGRYEKVLMILSLVIAGGFGRSDDGTVKFFMLLFLFAAVNLSLIIAAGQHRRNPNEATSLLDAPRAFYALGIGSMGKAGGGIVDGIRQGGAATRKFGAVTTGLLVSAPILVIMIILLTNADAAFEGLMDLLPEFQLEEYMTSGFWGAVLGLILYSRGVSLIRRPRPAPARREAAGVNALTVNTVLTMVCLVYVVYLLSQLAYLSGGLAGILPQGYTMAEYARRGFFEMSWLCAINLGLLCLAMWLIRSEGKLPRMTRIAGTFLGTVTIFLVVTASAKMFLYIGSYGLTWLRVMTEVIMLWLAITTVLVTIRLFIRKLPYMKAVVLSAMVLGALVFWVDVQSLVAKYNVRAYQRGDLETVDTAYLGELGSAGIPWLLELTEDGDPLVANMAQDILNRYAARDSYIVEDFRNWNVSAARAAELMAQYRRDQEEAVHALLTEKLGLELPGGTPVLGMYHIPEFRDGKRFLRVEFTPEEDALVQTLLREAGWNDDYIKGNARSLLIGNNAPFQPYRHAYSLNDNAPVFWYFADLHPEAGNIENIHSREGYRFLLAYYDTELHTLYYFEMDAPKVTEDA